MSSPVLSAPSGKLAIEMPGIWWLHSREDWTKDGKKIIDPALGADPIAILSYAKTHFAAQFMKRDRTDNTPNEQSYSAKNNTSAVGGYDAYFGTYAVDEQTGIVAHTLIGSITASNIGKTFMRSLRINGDTLMLQLETTAPDGEPITRTLVWKRIS